jgi:hypothetical protein
MSVRLMAVTLTLCLASALALGADAKPDAGKPKSKKFDLGLGPPKTFNAIPTGDGLQKPKEKSAQSVPTTSTTEAQYTVVSVVHGKSFTRTATGARPAKPFEQVATEGTPPMTEKFSTVVRVRCASKINASIDVVILDPRGDTLMEASGELLFTSQKDPELDWTVDWERTALLRGPGAYQVLIRVAGQPWKNTFPLKMGEPPQKTGPAANADAGAKTDPTPAK